MSQISVTLAQEDPSIRTRLIRLEVRSKKVVTPRRSLCLTQAAGSEAKALRTSSEITGVNELPREIDRSKLEDIDSDKVKQEDFYRNIRYRFSGIDTETDLTAFILSYTNREGNSRNRQPTSVETEYLCGLLNHPLNDIWVPPIVPELSGRSYLPYLREFYAHAATYHKIAIAGLIPHIARLDIRLLANFYSRLGLNYFVMDFAGKNPLDLVGNIDQTVRMIDSIERQTGMTCFLHGINVPITKAHWKNPVVPAKDILLFGMGFNCFGSNHVRRQMPDALAQKMKSSEKRPFRLFSREDYGYYRNDTTGLREMLQEQKATTVSFEDFERNMTWAEVGELEKLFNVERHGLEATTLRNKLIEGESLAEYIRSKSRVPDGYVKKVFDMKRQTVLA